MNIIYYTFIMFRKLSLLVVLLILVTSYTIYAQDEIPAEGLTEAEEAESNQINVKNDFWIGFGADTAFYGPSGLAYGGHLTFGYGSGSSIGLNGSFFVAGDNFNLLELDLLLRFYFFGKDAYWGPFVQIIGGAALINFIDEFSIPSNTGIINAGVSFGWRFVFFNRLFVEPAIRVGYPYFLRMGVSAGVRF